MILSLGLRPSNS